MPCETMGVPLKKDRTFSLKSSYFFIETIILFRCIVYCFFISLCCFHSESLVSLLDYWAINMIFFTGGLLSYNRMVKPPPGACFILSTSPFFTRFFLMV